ncbi:MAG TPA: hypothetical protein VIO84_04175 [Candidatus Dormibacteraeota bacterium]
MAAVGLLFLVAGCAADVPVLHPDLSAAQIAALPGQASINDAHYVTQFTGPDGTLYSSNSGTVELKPARALSQVTAIPPGPKGGFLPGEYREINGTAYNQLLAGWSHPRWSMGAAAMSYGFTPGNPVYFDSWPASGPFQVEGQEGSAVDRAWRLVAHPGTMGSQATVRLWIGQRDGYPLQYRMDFMKGSTRIVFDHVNSGARVKAPAAADMIPPPATLADAGRYTFSGGSIRVLAVDYAYKGPLVSAVEGSHQVGAESYVDAAPNPPLVADLSRWELIGADGSAYRTAVGAGGTFYGKGGGGGDQLAFFSVPNEAKGPFSLHVVLTDLVQNIPPLQKGPPPAPNVLVDALIKLS